MRHTTDGTLRRLVDEPAGVPDVDREHVAGCEVCLAGLAAAQQDASSAAAALHVDTAVDTAADVETAWARLSTAVAVEEHRRVVPIARRSSRWRSALRSPVVAGVGVVALLTGASAAAAADWLQIFRTERLAAVTVTEADLVDLPDLSAYGTLEFLQETEVVQVVDADAAQEVSGLSVPEVDDLPRGVSGEPMLFVGRQAVAEFTFSAEQARRAAERDGHELPDPPEGLDGSRFRLSAGPGVAAVWGEQRGLPSLVIGRAVAPTAESSGVPFETARDYLLSLPGLPDDVESQLRRFTGDGTTLPLPVPAEFLESSQTEVAGVPATLLASRDGTMSAVVWVDDGVVTAVAGSMSGDEVLSVAEGLQ